MVGDVQHADAAFPQAAHSLKETVHGRLLERRGRLVEDQETRPDGKGPRDLYDLPLLDGERRGFLVDVDVESPLAHQLMGLRPHAPPVDDRALTLDRPVEKDVLGHGERRHDHRPLVDACDAGEPRAAVGQARRGLAGQADGSAIGPVQAGEQRDEGRLPGTVAADQRMTFAWLHGERDVDQRVRLAERLRDVFGLAHRGRRCRRPGGREPLHWEVRFP